MSLTSKGRERMLSRPLAAKTRPDSVQVQRVRDQCIQGIGRYRHHFAAPYGRGRAFDRPHTRTFRVDLDQISGHLMNSVTDRVQ